MPFLSNSFTNLFYLEFDGVSVGIGIGIGVGISIDVSFSISHRYISLNSYPPAHLMTKYCTSLKSQLINHRYQNQVAPNALGKISMFIAQNVYTPNTRQ